jgi:hypothetical protein
MKRITVNVTDAQAAALKKCAARDGVRQAEQIRRAIDLAIFADKLAHPDQPKLACGLTQEELDAILKRAAEKAGQ